MRYYVNLPITWIHDDGKWLEFFREFRLNPELGFDRFSMGLSASWHRDNAARIKDYGLYCVAHLPFFGPLLGHKDAAARKEGVEVLKRATDIANIYEAGHLVGHPSFFAHSDADAARAVTGDIGARPSNGWLDNSLKCWQEVLAVTDALVYFENTHDTGPEAILELLYALSRGDYYAQIGMCFDLGHWYSFAQGCDRNNLGEWLDKISPCLSHLHLHDNVGHGDQHLGLGQGDVPLEMFFRSLVERRLSPTFTLEPHDLNSLKHSLAWLESHPATAEWLLAAGHKKRDSF